MGVYRSTGVKMINVKNLIVSFCFIKVGPLQIRLNSAPLELVLSLEPHGNSC